ncbi:coiled/coiled coil protein [Lineolata rhizophorae]|uniref:Coiled/coiled coil protein n=1 Tax=Lineolata rhizophorae TaxID=578093 RepID=A0A6A6NU41_9PEZI|nr:coiled/coiled coil protein [Lineolata rhizophorae]
MAAASSSSTDIVTDPDLQAALRAGAETRDQCLALLDFMDEHPVAAPDGAPPPPQQQQQQLPADTHAELEQRRKRLFAQLAQLRGLNRAAILGVRQTKQATAEARSEVDRLHLQLQNLFYEQRHLGGEIEACESYNHKYLQLPLIPVEEFLELHPEHRDLDEHALTIARINHEHAERQALEEKRQGLLKRKQGLIADNNRRRDDLANLDKDLEKFIDAATPIMKTFEKEY